MAYKIVFSEAASEAFSRLPTSLKSKIALKIDALATNPIPHNAKKMSGYDTLYRIRFSEWRIVYDVLESEVMVEILRIGNRKNVYEREF